MNFNVTGNPEQVSVSPMIILPFIENAFKYGAYAEEASEINISFVITGQTVLFTCDNAIFKNTNMGRDGYRGVGIKNVRRRLEILYPGKHSLKIAEQADRFFVELELTTENELHHN